jgi:DNA-binding transcriptional regulator YiaG
MNKWTGKKIRALRQSLRLSQKAFGDRLGVTQNYVYLLESGQKTPSGILERLLDCVKKRQDENIKKGAAV